MAHFKVNDIVSGLLNGEDAQIRSIDDIGGILSVVCVGQQSTKESTLVVMPDLLTNISVVKHADEAPYTGNAIDFKLLAEAERISVAYQFDPLFAVNCSVVDPLPHQVEAVYHFLLPLPKIRFLLADDTGAGKTIMTGLLLKELIMRGLINRILIVTPGGLTRQWQQDEMLLKFNLDFKIADRAALNSNPNLFNESERTIASIDFLSQPDIIELAKKNHYDIVVVDEAHKLSAYEYGKRTYVSRRYDAISQLAPLTEHLLLLTATPHRGRSDTFRLLLQLLDPDVFTSDDITNERIQQVEDNQSNRFFIRRLKEDMRNWDGEPLFKKRETITASYKLSEKERELYYAVTKYLLEKKDEANMQGNVHVNLTLTVMQRRLTSSVYAISRTLENRLKSLKSILDSVRENPRLLEIKTNPSFDFNLESLDDFDELSDDEREKLFEMVADPKKFKLFTTATNIGAIEAEVKAVEVLYNMANDLVVSGLEEQKLLKLKSFLNSESFGINDKIVIFTEHRDTLNYLERYLKQSGGYGVTTIHGGLKVDDRRKAQTQFKQPDTQVLIATDAAGEGINLQFCKLLVNWDIPWNPNRLEQRMGRIHRYGQTADVKVINLVANNTREGEVLEKLLRKLDNIREQLGNDRVYDVIQDVFQDVNLNDIIDSLFSNKKESNFERIVNEDVNDTKKRFALRISEYKNRFKNIPVDYKQAHKLKTSSDEKRLQPYYIDRFFDQAIAFLGGKIKKHYNNVFEFEVMPHIILEKLKHVRNLYLSTSQAYYTFDKDVFLRLKDTQNAPIYYLNPGHTLFDVVVQLIKERTQIGALKGALLVDPEANQPYHAYLIKTRVTDGRTINQTDVVADESIALLTFMANQFEQKATAHILDLHPLSDFNLNTDPPPSPLPADQINQYALLNIAIPRYNQAKDRILADLEKRKEYVTAGFNELFAALTLEISKLQDEQLITPDNKAEKIDKKINELFAKMDELKAKQKARNAEYDKMGKLTPAQPKIIGTAYVVGLTDAEFMGQYGMFPDRDVELVAMKMAMEHEIKNQRTPTDVSQQNVGYDIVSVDMLDRKRYIEVKGRATSGDIMLSQNEWARLRNLGISAYLYVVTNCKTQPQLHEINDPANRLPSIMLTKAVQYLVKHDVWPKYS